MIKLYTEEQVRKIYDLSFSNLDQDGSCIIDEDEYFKQILKTLTPIGLPSDGEIREASKNVDRPGLFWENEFARDSFVQCGKWMKEQILKQNK